MGQQPTEISPQLAKWISKQHVYFVATAPLAADCFVNCSPKGMDSLRVIDSATIAYLDLAGIRSIIRVQLTRVSDSCGYGVPLMDFRAERTQLRRMLRCLCDNCLNGAPFDLPLSTGISTTLAP